MEIDEANGLAEGVQGIADGVSGSTEVPPSLGLRLNRNETDGKSFVGLSEHEKEKLIMRCEDAGSKREMDKIMDSIVTDMDVTGLLEEQKSNDVRRNTIH